VTPQPYDTSSEEYGGYIENGFKSPDNEPLSTFSIDVDTASYSNIRRYIEDGMLPPADAVRLEECVNYFPYSYEAPKNGDPVGIGVTISRCPWDSGRCLARISLKARELDPSRAPVSNLVFLLDVSGSMDSPDKLPLVKHAISMLTEQLRGSDRVSIVVYAGTTGVVLEGGSGENKAAILSAVDSLSPGGTTAGAAGLELAYDIAERYYLEGGNNRVILCTDGDFNVGLSSPEELETLISEKIKTGVFLSVMGFGTGNVKDNRMETLADKGNGNYAYIDSESEAEKVFAKELLSTLFAVAKDVKVQVEFNPKAVKEYRLIGYDNRMLNAEDFNNDNKDAGEMGAGGCVTAFYEIISVNSPENSNNIDDLVFQVGILSSRA
jgi:Ca-activated chloride channel family protein